MSKDWHEILKVTLVIDWVSEGRVAYKDIYIYIYIYSYGRKSGGGMHSLKKQISYRTSIFSPLRNACTQHLASDDMFSQIFSSFGRLIQMMAILIMHHLCIYRNHITWNKNNFFIFMFKVIYFWLSVCDCQSFIFSQLSPVHLLLSVSLKFLQNNLSFPILTHMSHGIHLKCFPISMHKAEIVEAS